MGYERHEFDCGITRSDSGICTCCRKDGVMPPWTASEREFAGVLASLDLVKTKMIAIMEKGREDCIMLHAQVKERDDRIAELEKITGKLHPAILSAMRKARKR